MLVPYIRMFMVGYFKERPDCKVTLRVDLDYNTYVLLVVDQFLGMEKWEFGYALWKLVNMNVFHGVVSELFLKICNALVPSVLQPGNQVLLVVALLLPSSKPGRTRLNNKGELSCSTQVMRVVLKWINFTEEITTFGLDHRNKFV